MLAWSTQNVATRCPGPQRVQGTLLPRPRPQVGPSRTLLCTGMSSLWRVERSSASVRLQTVLRRSQTAVPSCRLSQVCVTTCGGHSSLPPQRLEVSWPQPPPLPGSQAGSQCVVEIRIRAGSSCGWRRPSNGLYVLYSNRRRQVVSEALGSPSPSGSPGAMFWAWGPF